MADTQGKSVANPEPGKGAAAPAAWRPFDDLRHEIDKLFEDFGRGRWPRSLRSGLKFSEFSLTAPAVDIVESTDAFTITAEMPGLDEKNVEVTFKNGNISIRGEKREEKEEKSKDYFLKERQYGSFERVFPVPEGADASKAEAHVKNGVLTVKLPKTPDAQKPGQKIEVKSG